MTPGPRRSPLTLAIALASLVVPVCFLASALAIVWYPWDWSPDEGLSLDMARRLVTGSAPLYGRAVVPFPDFYGPVLPLLLAPAVAWSAQPLAVARVIALGWTALVAAAVYGLVRRKSAPATAFACVALVLAPAGLTQWLMLIRSDGPMLALWLWSCVFLLPHRLQRGGDRLSGWRCLWGALLLTAAAFTKATAALHIAPVVASWLLVDRASVLRLVAVVAGLVALVVLGLTAVSHGGYLWVVAQWGTHRLVPGQALALVSSFLRLAGAPLAVAGLGAFAARRAGERWWSEPALGLWLGGAAVLPALEKGGAALNYTLPWLVATVVVAGRLWAVSGPRAEQWGGLAAAGGSLLCLALQPFPLPDVRDRLTAESFYRYVQVASGEDDRPILALTPDYAYFVIGQPVEMHGSGFPYLWAARARGVQEIEERIGSGAYSVIVATPQYVPADPRIRASLLDRYRQVADCRLGYYCGHVLPYLVFRRREAPPSRFQVEDGARCFVTE